MALHQIKKGLDLPISGRPEQSIHPGRSITRVALLGDDHPFMRPRMHVEEGDTVRRGQLLFEDRKSEGVLFTAPAAGRVLAINRGQRRVFQSLVIELSEAEQAGETVADEQQSFASFRGTPTAQLERQAVVDLLVESGLWTAVRRRPFSQIPAPTERCDALFVTAIDTNPLAATPEVVLEGAMEDFRRGLQVLRLLPEKELFLCRRPGSTIEPGEVSGIRVEEFSGPHPAGLPGTHMHLLAPVDADHPAWYVSYQDVVAVGRLFATGELDPARVVALGGPPVARPRLLRTRAGASIDELLGDEIEASGLRVISGSVLHGRNAAGAVWGYLGRYHQQISVLAEDEERRFLNWLMPGFHIYSVVRAFASRWIGTRNFEFTTSTRGGPRAMVPIGNFERVMPLDIMPTFLLRALVADDVERAEGLGCLELDEEDLALCSFVSPGKVDFGDHLRRNLTTIWKEG